MVEPHKSSIGGMDANVMAIISYLASIILSFIPYISYVAWLAPLVFYILEKGSSFVKFHAMQGFILNLLGMLIILVITIIFNIIIGSMIYNWYAIIRMTQALGTITLIISIVFAVFNIIALIKAYKYEEYEIPVVGKFARRFVK